MKRKKAFGIVGSTVLAASLLLNPYSFQWGKDESKVSASSFNRDVYVSSQNDFDKAIAEIKSGKIQEHDISKKVLDKGKIKFSNGKGKKASLESYEDLVFHIDEVRSDKHLQKDLAKAIKKGAKVYLYGGISIPEFADLLSLEKVTTKGKDSKGIEMTYRYDESESELAKTNKYKDNPESAYEQGEDFIYDVVGYTLDEEEHNQLVVTNINAFDEEGNKVEATEEDVIKDVLMATSETIDVEEQEYAAAQAPKLFGFLSPNNAKAATTVKSSSTRIYGYVKYGGTNVGRTYTDWVLQRGKSETDSTWDYFNVLDKTTIDAYSGWRATKWWIDHDIPYDRDYIWDWDPGSTSSGSYDISFGAPWSVGLGFTLSTDPDIKDIGNQDLDFGRWDITDYNMDGERFEPGTAWKSRQSYKHARMNITHRATMTKVSDKYIPPVSSNISIAVSYYY
ncbi:hypothetical protein [Cytobacillus oceanisediminis]|uniref:hypothetical protein n=1 Tax=Cytobacillus oceanisediminis TaxID=665099 RepID=UPI001FB295B8|nr:hypothetical protein [Cytobacillus oceanisediminis]UOE58224.1 hypothetical protein IRB79_27385 [Cytobacillus oceanisediminis]